MATITTTTTTTTLDDRFAQAQRAQQAQATTERGKRILTLLKRMATKAFSGVLLQGTTGTDNPAPDSSSAYAPLQTLEVLPEGVLRVRFRVPPHLCSGGLGEGDGGALTCGAVMAWFDEVRL